MARKSALGRADGRELTGARVTGWLLDASLPVLLLLTGKGGRGSGLCFSP